MAIWISIISGCRKFCCCSTKKNKQSERDIEQNGNIELSDSLLSEGQKNEIKQKYEKQISEKADRINALECRLNEIEINLDQLREENEELNTALSLQKPPISLANPSENPSEESSNKSAESITTAPDKNLDNNERISTLEKQCESLQFEIELKNTSLSKLQTSLNQVILRNENLNQEINKLEKESRFHEERDEKLKRLTDDNSKLRDDLNASLTDRDHLKHELMNQSQDVEQLQYRLSLNSSPD